ncbi:MAG: PEP-CTERM/exosortase system-associated acyltransferase [Gammaproteobacteria bacterium]|nr:PEP-CTERM/exosortase system-associated acyltransferase [Gammaproteobacteria bacterium]
MKKNDLVGPYRDYFKLIPADTDELRKEVFRIRYNVYCEDLSWEDSSRFPDKLESDEFDRHSRHCLLLHRSTGLYAGCVRLVLANSDITRSAIPLQQHCSAALNPEILDIESLPRPSFGEISRLAILNQYRRRVGEKLTNDGLGSELFSIQQTEKRRFPHIALGLYLGAASVGITNGLNAVLAMMQPRLARHLRLTAGIHFQQVGDVLDYHGPRAPFYITRAGLLDRLRPELVTLLEAIEEDLAVFQFQECQQT